MSNNSTGKKLEGKVAIVTGGASGIGETTARVLADLGARVVIADIQSLKGHAAAKAIGLDRCSFFWCDLTEELEVENLVKWTVQKYGGLDVMFSNAAVVSTVLQTVLDLDMEQFDRVMRVNPRSMALCVKHAARKMVELGTRGAIICTATTAAEKQMMNTTDYVMSKRAVLGLMRSASLQLGKHGIRVNSVSPGMVYTPLAANNGLPTPEALAEYIGPYMSLKGETVTEKNVADAVAFLASDEAALVTGVDLKVDGGIVAMPFLESN
ncbi:(+)-cis,cis-nepetalactol synthase NEPS3-like [Salvia hispanica]|uniref:(+)-cis,cis-nepetalactol synthase NEPS3-like n=1 Tax=Salvia hispanica TaxID=49212 RepID=UPI002009B7AC|nr:(+)-cis,cis-nepetalactol synthase NEPS3-like [Salvia hispanica]